MNRAPADRPKLSAAMEDYLKAIFLLQDDNVPVTTVALADRLAVAAPSVTNMVKRLQQMNLVLHSPYHGIELTDPGRAAAVEVVRHHRLIELYLATFLDVPWDRVHDEAERLEHAISEDLETRMADKLGQPDFDPHGHPIPSYEGAVSEPVTHTLWEAEEGSRVVVARVSDRDSALLCHLPSLDLVPGSIVEVVEVSPQNGTETIQVGRSKHVIGSSLAQGVRVRPASQPKSRRAERR